MIEPIKPIESLEEIEERINKVDQKIDNAAKVINNYDNNLVDFMEIYLRKHKCIKSGGSFKQPVVIYKTLVRNKLILKWDVAYLKPTKGIYKKWKKIAKKYNKEELCK